MNDGSATSPRDLGQAVSHTPEINAAIRRTFDRVHSSNSRKTLPLYSGRVEGIYLNQWCTLPWDVVGAALMLHPNAVGAPAARARYEFTDLPPEVNAVSVGVWPVQPKAQPVIVRLRVYAGDGEIAHECEHVLEAGQRTTLTAPLPGPAGTASVEFGVETVADAPNNLFCGVAWMPLTFYKNNELVDLCNRHRTDKGTEERYNSPAPHAYAVAYHGHFAELREREFNLLEIGLDTPSRVAYPDGSPIPAKDETRNAPTNAPSLRVWREYFPNATLYGFDLNDFSFFTQRDTHIGQGDQGSREDLLGFLDAHGNPSFGLILDDGSHAAKHQQISLAVLFPFVAPGGIYIIEDLGWQPYDDEHSTLAMFARYAASGILESPYMSQEELQCLRDTIATAELIQPNDCPYLLLRKT